MEREFGGDRHVPGEVGERLDEPVEAPHTRLARSGTWGGMGEQYPRVARVEVHVDRGGDMHAGAPVGITEKLRRVRELVTDGGGHLGE
ncbi:hypothetical protein [Tsukamurella soli]|uniref:hypothetical protein n=1 Tax=Tsukamurella soli TaxID=644556 RepID=UPI0036221718